uniref:Uncharacterized protein n=1 Tax=Moniliophthora roreri TaxID=221103 RepID=A0A0W0FY68_MONRR
MSSYTNPSVRTGLPPFNPPVQVFPDDAIHTKPFHPSTFELLYLMNCEHYDEELTTAIDASSERNRALYSCLIFLRGQQRQLLENMTRLDQHIGMLAQHISDNETFTVTGAIATQILTEIASLQMRTSTPTIQPSSERLSPIEEVSNEQLRSPRASTSSSLDSDVLEWFRPQSPLPPSPRPTQPDAWMRLPAEEAQLPSRASAVYLPTSEPFSTPIHSPLQTTPKVTTQMSPTPAEEPQNSLMSPHLLPHLQCLPAMNSPPPLPVRLNPPGEHSRQQGFLQNSRTPYSFPPPLSPSTQTPNVPIVSVWDDEDAELDDRASLIETTSNDPITHTTVLLDEVHQELSVLCANWETTAPSTVWTMSARFATLIKLAISLDIVGTEEGLRELWDETIPAVHRLLTTIADMIPRGTMPTMETGNNERPQDPPLGDGIVVDMGSPEGPRVFRRIDRETEIRELREPQWQGEWLIGGQPIALNV